MRFIGCFIIILAVSLTQITAVTSTLGPETTTALLLGSGVIGLMGVRSKLKKG